MKKYGMYLSVAALVLLGLFFTSPAVLSHCEIPCGIYGDPMRIDMMFEDIQTIEKSMKKIEELSKEKDKDYNQLTRWIINKGDHADKLSETVTQYFMKQRIEPVEKNESEAYQDYVKKLTLLHELMFYSMKCKQTTDLDYIPKLREALTEFKTAYFGNQGSSAHGHSH